MLSLVDHAEYLLRRLRPRLVREERGGAPLLRRMLSACCAEMERALATRPADPETAESPPSNRLPPQDPGARRRAALETRRRALGLTGRQLEIAELVGRGSADKEIAAALGIATQTVKNHLKRMYATTAARGRAELVRLLHEQDDA